MAQAPGLLRVREVRVVRILWILEKADVRVS
jgi:hypothetical protein